MPKIIASEPKKKTGKWVAIWLIIIIVLAAAGVGGWYWYTHKSSPNAADSSKNQNNSTSKPLSTEAQKATQAAVQQMQSGDTSAAAKTLGDAAASATDSSDKASLYSQQASVYANSNQNDQAITAYKQAIAADPTNWKPYGALGLLYSYSNDNQNAITYLKQSVALKKQYDKDSNANMFFEVQGTLARLEGAS